MARARKSHDMGEENTKTEGKLKPAYSNKVDGHRYVIYASYRRGDDSFPRNLVLKFLATYAARFFVTKLIADDDFEWRKWMNSDDMIVTTRGIEIRAHASQMKEIMDYEPTGTEASWRDDQVIANVNRFKFGAANTDLEVRAGNDNDAERSDVPDEERGADLHTRTSKRERKADRPKREARPKVDTSGYVSANDFAKELKTEGRIIRGVLRALGLVKPEHGWSWPKAQAKDIRAKVEKALKEDKKKRAAR